MIMAATWFMLSFVLGAVVFFTAGLITALFADELSESIGAWYVDMAQTARKNTALVVGETGGLSLVSPSWEPQFSGDMAKIGGEAGHWQNNFNVKTSLSGKPFGIGLQGYSEYISPSLAEIGKRGKEQVENGALGMQGNGEARLDFTINQNPQIVDLRHASKALMGSCKRRWSIVSERWGQISQEGFHEKVSAKQTFMLIAAFAVSVGLAFVIFKYGPAGGGGGGGSTIALPGVVMFL
jgi:hypothetical protein